MYKSLSDELNNYKYSIDLNNVVQAFGYEFIKTKSSVTSKQYINENDNDKIVVTFKDNKYIYFNMDYDKSDSGTIVDFLQHRGIGNLGDVLRWCRNFTNNHYTYTPMSQEHKEIIDKDKLKKIWFVIKNIDPIPEIRGIKTEILKQAIDTNSIKIDENLNIYFALIDLKGLCGIERRNIGEKRILKSSKKGVWKIGAKAIEAKKIVICESGIDALSYMQLHDDDVDNTMYIATIGQYGNGAKEIITLTAKTNKQANWIVATDNDQAGEKMANQIITDIISTGTIEVKREKSRNKDWNEDLMQYGENNKEAKMSEKESKPAFVEQAKDNGNGNNNTDNQKNQAKEPRRINTFIGPADEIIDIEKAGTNDPPKIDMIWPGFMTGTVGALIGPSNVGKSFWTIQSSMAVAATTERVIYVNIEDHRDVLKHRIHYIYKYLTDEQRQIIVQYMTIVSKRSINIMNNTLVKDLIDYCKGSKLIVFDTLSRIHKLDENKNTDMISLIEVLEEIADKTSAGVLFLHHMSKSAIINDQTTDQTAARGASALITNIRYAGYLIPISDKETKKYVIDPNEKRHYVKYGVSKQSFGEVEKERWYKRQEAGVLKQINPEEIAKNKGGYYDKKDKRL